jgi:hypothetical protein
MNQWFIECDVVLVVTMKNTIYGDVMQCSLHLLINLVEGDRGFLKNNIQLHQVYKVSHPTKQHCLN